MVDRPHHRENLKRSRQAMTCSRVPTNLIALLVILSTGTTLAIAETRPLAPLPPIATVVPKDNPMTPEKIELGKMLFFDPRLAGDSSISCAKCHAPEKGFSNATQLSDAYPGTKHWRHVPTVLNAAYAKLLFWDGRSQSLEDQAKGPVQAPIEMNQNPGHLVEKLDQIPYYKAAFRKVFKSDVTFDNIAKAIAAFERTIVSRNVPFDDYLRGDKSALDAEQVRGLELFKGKANCIACHNGPLLSDDKLHATGVAEIKPLMKDSDRVATRHFFAKDAGYKNYKIDADYGRELITKSAADRYKFKTPSLREIADTAPYMHNGALLSLEDVVDFYNRGGGQLPNKDPRLVVLNLSDGEKSALIAFLESLSGDLIEMTAPSLPKKADGTF
jgi:cytochrome c peroxidase